MLIFLPSQIYVTLTNFGLQAAKIGRACPQRELSSMDDTSREMAFMLKSYLDVCITKQGIPPDHCMYNMATCVPKIEEARVASFNCSKER